MHRRYFVIIFALLLALPFSASHAKKMTINTAFTMPISSSTPTNSGSDGIFDKLMEALFKEIGMEAEVKAPHAERALRYANSGIADGDGPRIAGLDEKYRNLVRVEEPVIKIDFVGFTTGTEFTTQDWESLKGRSVGIVSGWKILERNIPHAIRFKDAEEMFNALKEQRVDVAVIERLTGEYTAKQVGIDTLEVLGPPLAQRDMFLYLHKKHSKLLPKLKEALETMKEDGRYEKLMTPE